MDDLVVGHEDKGKHGAFFIELEGRRVGEMIYAATQPGTITITHTEVGPELRGRNAGLSLVAAGVAWARDAHLKVIAQCPFAKATIAKHKEFQDVLAEEG